MSFESEQEWQRHIDAEELFKQTGDRTLEEAQRVIANGHPPEAEKRILIDFDGCIAPFGYLFDFPKPLRGVVSFTHLLRKKGFTIGIFTSRLNDEWLNNVNQSAQQHIEYITEYCRINNIKFDFITGNKYPAIRYYDDKAINVHDNWDELILEAEVNL